MTATITRAPWGTVDGQSVDLYTLAVPGAATVRISNYGGIVQAIEVPDCHGAVANVVLGFDDLASYRARSPYFGCIAGRFANRIAGGRFNLDGTEHQLATNLPPHHLHGGAVGFDKRVWTATPTQADSTAALVLASTSPDGEEGYPGALATQVTYSLRSAAGGVDLRIDYCATTDAATVVNLTNHSYFNLAGEGSGLVTGHVLTLAADHYAPTDATQIPTGEIAPVAGTPFDFTRPTPVGARIHDDHPQLAVGHGYDHNLVLRSPGTLSHAARVVEPSSGRALDVLTTEPGIQLYTSNTMDSSLVGPSGRMYGPHAGIALETQHYPDSPNQPGFPSTVLRPGETHRSTTVYRFHVAA